MKVEGQYDPEKTICKWRWSYPVILVDRGEVRTCDKTVNFQLTEEDFQNYGTDAFINHPYLLKRRYEKLNGLRHKDCFNCIILEDKGLMSSRTGEGPFVEWMNSQLGEENTFEDYRFKSDQKLLRADKPDLLEISLSNQCNLKCIYCSATFSTEWERENVKFGDQKIEDTHRRTNPKPPSFDKYFWLWFEKIVGGLKRIIFIGGEPLLNKNFVEYLQNINERCPDNRNVYEKPIIQIISNFGIPNKKFVEVLDVIEELTKNYIVHLEVSGEAFGKRSEYIRAGLKWDTLVENVHSTLERGFPNFRFGLQLAVNNLCITSQLDLFKWAWDLQVKYNTLIDFKENIVVAPHYLSPYTLDPSFVKYVDETIDFVKDHFMNPDKGIFKDTAFKEDSTQRWATYLPFLESIKKGIRDDIPSDFTKKEFFNFAQRMEHRRAMNFLEYFPEYESFYNECKSAAEQ